jgi:hypothetical protein
MSSIFGQKGTCGNRIAYCVFVCVCHAHKWGNGGVFFLVIMRVILLNCHSLWCGAVVVGKHRKDPGTGQQALQDDSRISIHICDSWHHHISSHSTCAAPKSVDISECLTQFFFC